MRPRRDQLVRTAARRWRSNPPPGTARRERATRSPPQERVGLAELGRGRRPGEAVAVGQSPSRSTRSGAKIAASWGLGAEWAAGRRARGGRGVGPSTRRCRVGVDDEDAERSGHVRTAALRVPGSWVAWTRGAGSESAEALCRVGRSRRTLPVAPATRVRPASPRRFAADRGERDG